jgi:hypothetical protein
MRHFVPSLYALSLSVLALLSPAARAQSQNDQNFHPPTSGTAVASGERPPTAAKGEVNAPYLPGFAPPAATGGNLATETPNGAGKEPLSTSPSRIVPPPAGSPPYAARLPSPDLPEGSSASQYLAVAADALARNQTGLAQSALGHAETRLLSRSVPLFQTDKPSANPAVTLISQARQALGAGDVATAQALVAKARPIVVEEEAHPRPTPQVGLPAASAPDTAALPQAAPQPVPAPAASAPMTAAPTGSVLGTAPGALPAPEPMTR